MTQAITPKSATNILIIEVVALLAASGGAKMISGALFQDATANAIAATTMFQAAVNAPISLVTRHQMVAGTASAITFRYRAGAETAGTTGFNGLSTGRIFGATPKSVITITEYKA